MDEPVEKPRSAWQPLTARGVAAFADAPLGRLLLVQAVVAVLAAATVVLFLRGAWFPTIEEAIGRLPAQGEIRAGVLEWQGESPARLAEGHFLAVTVDLQHAGEARSPADVQVEFGQKDVKLWSFLGFVQGSYPKKWIIAFNQAELVPWWGAWRPAILAVAAGGVITGLMGTWALLATVYCVPVWLLGLFVNRQLSLGGSWRMAGAALMPGALLLTTAIFLYGLGGLDLVRLSVAAAAHLAIGWGFLVASSLCRPRHPATAPLASNPFSGDRTGY